MMTEWDKFPQTFLPNILETVIHALTISRHSSLVPSENGSIIWFANILKPWLPARSNFYFVKNTRVAWFPFIIDKSQLQLGSGIRSFSGNKSFRSHLLNTDPVVKLGNKNYYPSLLSLSTKKFTFQLFALCHHKERNVCDRKGNMRLQICAISSFYKSAGACLLIEFIITILRY